MTQKIFQEVKNNFPEYTWFEEPEILIGKKNFNLGKEDWEDWEVYGGKCKNYDLNIKPKVEFTFECDEGSTCMVYTDETGNISFMLLNID